MSSKLLSQLTFYLLVLLSGSHVFQLRHTTRDTAGKGEEERWQQPAEGVNRRKGEAHLRKKLNVGVAYYLNGRGLTKKTFFF